MSFRLLNCAKVKCAQMEFSRQLETYLKLIAKPKIERFLNRDCCCAIVDKYHLVNVLLYFIRAELTEEEYTIRNFYLALYLSHEVYEEVDLLKLVIMRKGIGKEKFKDGNELKKFDYDRFKFFEKMNFNAITDRKISKQILKILPSRVWKRKREEIHGNVICNEKVLCERCHFPIQSTHIPSKINLEDEIISNSDNKFT